MVTPVQDWGLIDNSLRDDIPKLRGARKEYARLNSTVDTMLDIKAVATRNQIHVPGLHTLLDLYLDTVWQGKHLRQKSWWKSIRGMRDWHGSKDEFQENCHRVWDLAHQTSFMVHAHADNLAAIPQVSIRRRRSLDGLVQAEPDLDLIQPHNPHGDTPVSSKPPSAGLVAQSSSAKNSINPHTVTLPEETVRRRDIAETSAAKRLEQFMLHGRLPIPQTINNFNGCIVKPRATHTVNFGGSNIRGAAINISPSPTEFKWNGADDIDGTSDDDETEDLRINVAQKDSSNPNSPTDNTDGASFVSSNSRLSETPTFVGSPPSGQGSGNSYVASGSTIQKPTLNSGGSHNQGSSDRR